MDYLRNVEASAAASSEHPLGKTEDGEQMFKIGGFLPKKMKVPDSPEHIPRNPESKEELAGGIAHVLQSVKEWEGKVDEINPNHKIEHCAFGWLNAREWFDLVGMHLRHHLRQKAELDQKLKL